MAAVTHQSTLRGHAQYPVLISSLLLLKMRWMSHICNMMLPFSNAEPHNKPQRSHFSLCAVGN